MCDLINNHTDGGENWTAKRCYVGKKGEIIIKGKKANSVSENILTIFTNARTSLSGSISFLNAFTHIYKSENKMCLV